MNILLIGRLYKDTFTHHIFDTLGLMGHKVYVFQPGLKTIYSNSKIVKGYILFKNLIYNAATHFPAINRIESNKLFRFVKKYKIELTISVHDFLTPEQVTIIKHSSKSPVVIWFPDAISNFNRAMFLNADYDYLFFKDPYIVTILRNELIKNAFYLPECCNPLVHKPIKLTTEDRKDYECDITTAGNMYTNRAAFFNNLTKYNVKIWGNPAPGWMDISNIKKMVMDYYITGDEKAKAFGAAKIVLNNLHPAEIWGVNCRAFEIPACGGFQIINSKPCLDQLFSLDKEIVAFENYNDLIEKLDYYLRQDKERKYIAEAGKERAHREHTYKQRLELMFNTIFGNEKGFQYSHLKIKS
ncbi:MAG: glycosyltransferase [Ignavibacteriaceae bacterium]|nr:glycosyltransferase [Ignavibacteriaceae bacterium]